ncbi:MAG: hypothetical protein IKJ27_01125 [Clostridia bacterium]|nr:hypothetical protein [Clostridia bacterium]
MLMKILLNKTVTVTPENERTNIFLPFAVPSGVKKLIIDYSYSPKELTDREKCEALIKENLIRDCGEQWTEYTDYGEFMPLKNLITLSLDSPEGYVGAAHRQAATQHHEIGEEFASVGFDKVKISAGEWVLTLNLHAVVTDECVCEIEVKGYE